MAANEKKKVLGNTPFHLEHDKCFCAPKKRSKKGFVMSEAVGRKDEGTYFGVCEEFVGWFLTEQLHRGKVTGGGVSRQLLQQRPAASRDGPGTGLGVVSVSEKSNTVQISLNSSSWRPKVGGGSSLLPVYKIF